MLHNLRPDVVTGPLAITEAAALIRQLPEGILGITWDLDRTLAGHNDTTLPSRHLALIMGLDRLGLRQGFNSNAGNVKRSARVETYADYISQHISQEMIVATSYMANGRRKPSRHLYDLAAQKLGLLPENICHVGDQDFKDVVGAKLAGYGAAVLVPPYGTGDNPAVRYLQRPLEAIVRPLIGVPFRTKNFGKIAIDNHYPGMGRREAEEPAV